MLSSLRTIWVLTLKEIKSVLSDKVLMGLIVIIFSVSTYTVTQAASVEVKNAAIAVVNEDRSDLSWRLIDALQAPHFQTPVEITLEQIDDALDKGQYTFILVIPVDYEKNLLRQHGPDLQLLIDATAVSQAGIGAAFIQQIIAQETRAYFQQGDILDELPARLVSKVLFNPNADYAWFSGPAQITSNTALLAMLLVGAAIIREKERGTIEHLLVMPVRPYEIALSKILSNGLVITVAAMLSLYFVVHLWLGVPLTGSIPLFLLALVVFLFSACSLGILLGTIAPTMPQFGLLVIPVYVIMRLLSGGESPREGMPELLQRVTEFSPLTQLVTVVQNVFSRQAGLDIVWPNIVFMLLIGVVFFVLALGRFKAMLARQG